MPVPPVIHAPTTVCRPHHHMGHAGCDLMITTGATVHLRGRATGDPADRPLPVAPRLYAFDTTPDQIFVERPGGVATALVAARAHSSSVRATRINGSGHGSRG